MKVLSIKEFHKLNKNEEDNSQQKMHNFLHKDSQERLGSKSIIEQGLYSRHHPS
jgi:hypothetical protein